MRMLLVGRTTAHSCQAAAARIVRPTTQARNPSESLVTCPDTSIGSKHDSRQRGGSRLASRFVSHPPGGRTAQVVQVARCRGVSPAVGPLIRWTLLASDQHYRRAASHQMHGIDRKVSHSCKLACPSRPTGTAGWLPVVQCCQQPFQSASHSCRMACSRRSTRPAPLPCSRSVRSSTHSAGLQSKLSMAVGGRAMEEGGGGTGWHWKASSARTLLARSQAAANRRQRATAQSDLVAAHTQTHGATRRSRRSLRAMQAAGPQSKHALAAINSHATSCCSTPNWLSLRVIDSVLRLPASHPSRHSAPVTAPLSSCASADGGGGSQAGWRDAVVVGRRARLG